MRLYFILFIFFLLVSFSFQKTVLAANHVKENTGKCIKGDCINGNGTFDDGVRIYTGQFKDGKYNGQGSSVRRDNGNKYEGEWKNGKANGKGTNTFSDGRKYIGEFKDNKRHGQGTFTLPDGTKHVGGWKDNKRHGQGVLTFSNGNKEVGEWKDGRSFKTKFFDSTGRKITKFERTIVCKNNFGASTVLIFKDFMVITKTNSGPGESLKVSPGFSNVMFSKNGNIIEWKGTFRSGKNVIPVRNSLDLQSMSYYSDLNIYNLSNPKKIKLNMVCE